jgi:hypothetical protein
MSDFIPSFLIYLNANKKTGFAEQLSKWGERPASSAWMPACPRRAGTQQ